MHSHCISFIVIFLRCINKCCQMEVQYSYGPPYCPDGASCYENNWIFKNGFYSDRLNYVPQLCIAVSRGWMKLISIFILFAATENLGTHSLSWEEMTRGNPSQLSGTTHNSREPHTTLGNPTSPMGTNSCLEPHTYLGNHSPRGGNPSPKWRSLTPPGTRCPFQRSLTHN